jgi:hypothetical protein
MKKWTNELSRTFSKEEVQKAKKKKNEEMFNIAGHKGNLNQNHIRFHLTPVRITIKKKRTQTMNVGEDMGKKEPSYTAGGSVN